jgi:hypothetical protein
MRARHAHRRRTTGPGWVRAAERATWTLDGVLLAAALLGAYTATR